VNIDISTPALLFPAITLLLLAFTNRFVALATLARGLRQRFKDNPDIGNTILGQIKNLRIRLILIRNMQAFGIGSFFCCVLSMILIYFSRRVLADYVFGFSLFLLLVSLVLSFIETQISTKALSLELSDLESKSSQNA